MGIPVTNLLPQFASAPAAKDGGSGKQHGDEGFGGLLAVVSSKKPEAKGKADAADGSPAGADAATMQAELLQVLQSLADGPIDVHAPGLGLNESQQQRLLANLEKLLQGGEADLASLLGGLAGLPSSGQIPTDQLQGVARLLGTGAEGSLSLNALLSNLQLLANAVQLVSSSGGKLTLLQAVQELAPAGDAFVQELEKVLRKASEQDSPTALLGDATGPPGAAEPGQVPRDGPQESSQASATAGSNGREMTPASAAGSPADGAAEEAKASDQISQLADLLQALVDRQKSPQQTGASPHSAATPAGAGHDEARISVASDASGPPQTAKQAAKAQGPWAAALAALAVEAEDRAPSTATGGEASTGDSSHAHQPAVSDRPNLEATAEGTLAAGVESAPLPSFAAAVAQGAGNAAAPARAAIEQSIVDQLVQSASLALKDGQQEFRVQLKPEFLGSLEVRVSIEGGVAVVRMAAENAGTRQLIDANIAQLRQAFGTGEVRIEHVPHFGSSDAAWSFNQAGHQGLWSGHNPQQGSGALPMAIPFSGQAEAEPEAESNPTDQGQPALSGVPDARPLQPGGIDIQA